LGLLQRTLCYLPIAAGNTAKSGGMANRDEKRRLIWRP
jgi:hypothetical protein